MYGGTPKFEGSSTYPSRITTFMGRNPCGRGDKGPPPPRRTALPAAYLLPQRPNKTRSTTMITVITAAVPMNKTYCTESAGAVVLTFASASPPCTTWFHNSAITNPKAVVKAAAIVFRTSAAESFRCSAMVNPEPGWTTEFLGFTVTAPGSLSPLSRHGHPQSARLDTAPSNPSRGASPCPRP